jgi:signal transduction histidine kinase
MSRTTYALLAIAPEIIALVIIVWYGLRMRRQRQFEQKLRTLLQKPSSPEEERLATAIKARIKHKLRHEI